MDAEGQLYALFNGILYKVASALTDCGISGKVLEPIPLDTKGPLSFGGVKSYMQNCGCIGRSVPLISALFKAQLYYCFTCT